MKIIIAGAGAVGTHLAKLLSDEKQDIILMDENEEKLSKLDSNFDLMTVNASPTSISGLKNAGVAGADLFIGVMPERDSRIAAIPIGYADGLNRRLGNGHAYCLVNGQKAPYVGNICMDVCMIDVTDIDCKEGDKAIIFGDDLPVTVLSEILETIPYEILTSVSNRVKRVYYQN